MTGVTYYIQVNCIFLYSHIVHESNMRQAPPPFNLLSFPYWLWTLLSESHHTQLVAWFWRRAEQVIKEAPLDREERLEFEMVEQCSRAAK